MSQHHERDRRFLAIFVLVMLALGLLGGCSVAWLLGGGRTAQQGTLALSGSDGSGAAGSSQGHGPFAASGSVTGLTPGRTATLNVIVTNTDSVAYRILQLTATPQDASPHCRADNLVVQPYSATTPGAVTYVVPRRSSATIPLTIALRSTAWSQDACKNVHFALTYSGSATATTGAAAS